MDKYIFISKLGEHSSEEFNQYINDVFEKLCFLKKSYPNFKKWYYEKVVNDIKYGKREILIRQIDEDIAAIAILKKCDEIKICSFLVLPQYRKRGIGKELMEKSMDILGTKKPMITVSSESMTSFRQLLNNFGFEQYEKLDNYYKKNSSEYVFNGYLSMLKSIETA